MAHDTEHFKVNEFACKHCGENEISQKVINMAEEIRQKLGVPVRVNSGYRCEEHNKNVGGVKGSKHTKGLAADLSCKLGASAMLKAVKELRDEGKLKDMDYCIIYRKKNFIHVDCGGKRKNLYEERP